MARTKKTLEDGSPASTGHKPKAKKPVKVEVEVSEETKRRIAIERKIEGYTYQIREEAKKLASLTEEISSAYSQYAESNSRIDDETTLHNGLANMLKLIEVQTTTKLRIKKMQTNVMQIIADTTGDEELPYAIQDIMREVNVNFLDSKLVRAYGEIAKIMKEDSDLAKVKDNEIRFVNNALTSELEEMETEIKREKNNIKEVEDGENDW